MKAFARLLDGLLYSPGRNAKIAHLVRYFQTTPDPDRGWALAALTGELDIKGAKAALVRQLIAERSDPELFALSYDYVGDLAETCALLWPTGSEEGDSASPTITTVVETLRTCARDQLGALLAGWLDASAPHERWALLKLLTGGLRVGVSARLAKVAFSKAFSLDVADVEEVWHALTPPYSDLFLWAEGKADKPRLDDKPVFRPFMLAGPLEEWDDIDLQDYWAEWKWDGIRVQLVRRNNVSRLYSRSGDDISHAFPDVVAAFLSEGIIDGELLVRSDHGDDPASFNALQQRLNRKKPGKKLMAESPAFIRAYDILFDGVEDLRDHPLELRRRRLEAFVATLPGERFDLSDVLEVDDMAGLERLRQGARERGYEGLMLKQRRSPYQAGRQKGLWYKWKRDPLGADTVLMYAQRGHGKRSSFYSDFTFGAWTADGDLVPVGKAYSGFSDEELVQLDKWVRNNTINRFGPVREVSKELVLEVAFDSIHRSTRHKSGVAMRFPRIKRLRFDKPAAEADALSALEALIE